MLVGGADYVLHGYVRVLEDRLEGHDDAAREVNEKGCLQEFITPKDIEYSG